MDHLRRVVQEAAKASQPHQILFVFQLKANRTFRRLKGQRLLPGAELLAVLRLTHLAGDVVDVVAMHELGRDGKRDQLAAGVVVFLFVPQLWRQKRVPLKAMTKTKRSRRTAPRIPYVTQVFLVHLDLFDVGGVIGRVDFVLLLVIVLAIQALRKEKKTQIYTQKYPEM